MLLNSFSLTNPVPQLLSIKACSVSRPIPIKSRPAKLRETLLINFYKWCNASLSFSNSQCGCYFLWKKGKKHEEQICNSTEQFLILRTLTAITCSKVFHQSRDLRQKKKKSQLLTLSLDSWATTTTCAAHVLRAPASLSSIWRSIQARMIHSFFTGPSRYVHVFSTQGLKVSLPHLLILQILRPS